MRHILKLLMAAVILGLLCGCTVLTGDDLLQAPKPTKNYIALQTELERVLSTGAVYASPISGQNRNTVQLKDLDGDGEEEAIALFRESSISTKFWVYVYKKIGDAYIQMGMITGNGTAMESIDYPLLTPDGKRGIVIAWQLVQDGTTGLSVSALQGAQLVTLQETEYSSFEMIDLDADGADELVTVNMDAQGKKNARMYDYSDGKMPMVGEAALNVEATSIVRVQSGYALNAQPAVFVEEKNDSGVGLMTDIFMYQDGIFRNCALEAEQNLGYSTYRPVPIYAIDINSDNMIDIPRAKLTPGYSSDSLDPQYYLEWYTFGIGVAQKVKTTYQSQLEEWMLNLPEAWQAEVKVQHTMQSSGIACTTFSQEKADGSSIALLKIYYLTGEMRAYFAQNEGMLSLKTSDSAVYTAQIPADASKSELYVNIDQVRDMFALVTQEWSR